NLAIREINALQDATYDKKQALAEMRLLRGHFHFELYRIYNKIPYLDENADPTKTSNIALSVDKVLEKIGEDFKFAYDNLTPTSAQVGRVNKYVAAAYLAKFYLETKQWDAAADMADYVITGPYDLLPNQEDLWTIANENGSESVFAIQYSTENFFANHDWGSLLNVTSSPGIDLGGYAAGDDFYHGSQNLVNAYRTDANGFPLFTTFNDVDVTEGYVGNLDPRLDFTVGRIGIPWKNSAIYDESWMRSSDYPGYSSKKQVVAPNEPGINKTFPWAAAGLNYYIIRYAEVLLWKAEAEIERASPDLGAALSAINEVRNRAKNSEAVFKLDGSGSAATYKVEPYNTFASVDDAREALRMERRLEMALEGHRLFDLNRWGITASTMNTYFQNEDRFYLDGMSFTANKHEFFPIPQSQIDLAPDLYEQNNY
nr:RagB/SusD family nutrient uptake outer membrane protein [Bacteroidales bacterium]